MLQNGFFDAIDVAKIVEATSSLREFLETRGLRSWTESVATKQLVTNPKQR